MGHAGSDCPKIQCFNCSNFGHISSLCTNQRTESMLECFLCHSEHRKGECPDAGKIFQAPAKCTICIKYYKDKNEEPKLAMHIFTQRGFAGREMCPVILAVSRQDRSRFLSDQNICTICLRINEHNPNHCPLKKESRSKYLCLEPTCPYPKQHMGIDPDYVDGRTQRAITAGIPVTMLNVAQEGKARLDRLKNKIE